MVKIGGFGDEKNIVLGLYVITAFLAVNVQPQIVGVVYSLFVIGYILNIENAFGIQKIQIFKGGVEYLKPAFFGAFLFATWLVVLNLLSNAFAGSVFSAVDTSVLAKIYAQSNVQISFDSIFLKLGTFGVMIPVAESLFLAVLMGMWGKWIKFNVFEGIRRNFKTVAIVILVGVTFSLFHIFVRLYNASSQGEANFALLSDVVFFGMSSLVVLKFRELSQAAWFHIIVNSSVIAKGLGLI